MKKYFLVGLFFQYLLLVDLFAQIDLTSNLLAHYEFSGNANDITANGNNGTTNGVTLTTDRFGNSNSAYSFDGVNDYISLPSNNLQSSNYTFSVWVNVSTNPTTGNAQSIISIGNLAGDQGLGLNNNYNSTTGFIAGGYNPDATNQFYYEGSLPTVSTWYHLVSVRDDNYMYLYVNGQLEGSVSTSGKATYYSTPVLAHIGTRPNFIQHFNGIIDDVRIYSRALTACEISTLFYREKSSSDLIAHYPFSGNTDDLTGNGNNGTANGVTLTADRFGNLNSAYSFDGVDDYISLPSTNFQNKYYSYSTWVNVSTNPTSGNAQSIISIGNLAGDQGLGLNNNYNSTTGFIAGGYNPDATNQFYYEGSLPTVSTWYHLVSVRDDNYMYLYINGQLEGSASTSGKATYYSTPVLAHIGTRPNFIQHFSGTMDEVRIYGRALSSCEVEDLYNSEVVTGIFNPQTSSLSSVNVFPVPASNHLTVEAKFGSTLKEISLMNSLGHEVYKSNPGKQGSLLVNLPELPAGIYFLHVKTDNEEGFKKIVIE